MHKKSIYPHSAPSLISLLFIYLVQKSRSDRITKDKSESRLKWRFSNLKARSFGQIEYFFLKHISDHFLSLERIHMLNFCFLHSFYFSNFQVFKPYLWDPLKNKKDWFKINPQCYFTLSNTVYSMLYLHTLYLSHTHIHTLSLALSHTHTHTQTF